MAGAGEELLHVDVAAAEGLRRLGPAAFVGGGEVVVRMHRAHAPSAAAGEGLDHDRDIRTERGAERLCGFERGGAVGAGQDGHAGLAGDPARGGLVAEQIQRLRAGADEDQPGIGAGAGEGRVLAEEAVAGMDRVAAGFAGGSDDLGGVEVGRHADALEREAGIGCADMEGVRVVLGMDADGLDPHFGGGTDDADRDFAAIGDEQFLDGHVCFFPCPLTFPVNAAGRVGKVGAGGPRLSPALSTPGGGEGEGRRKPGRQPKALCSVATETCGQLRLGGGAGGAPGAAGGASRMGKFNSTICAY